MTSSAGVPASSGSPVADLMAVDFGDEPRSVHLMLIDEALAAGRRAGPPRTTQEEWVEDGSRAGGHWEAVS